MNPKMTRRDAARTLGLLSAATMLPAHPTPASDICSMTAVEMARLIRRKELSAREVMSAHLAQIERVNPKVNAIVTLHADHAMDLARAADDAFARGETVGPLHGLPVAHKDLRDTAGIRTTYGSPIFKDHIPGRDSIIVEKIRKAGAISVGKTNTPEFGAGSQTFNKVFGATRNPYDLSKTCGGSSGGAAVALACRMLPIADGSDTGGSLRNPAAFCNVVGLRTSPGRVPQHAGALAWSPLSVEGPMARTVEDVALFLSAIVGPDARCPIAIAEPGEIFRRDLSLDSKGARDFKGVRVCWFKDLGGQPFEPRVRDVVNAQRKTFVELGCSVEEAEPDFSGADESFKVLRAQGFHAAYGALLAEHHAEIKDTVIEELERGARLTGPEIAAAEAMHAQLFNRFREFFQRCEYFVLPTTQVAPFDLQQPYPTEVDGKKMQSYIDWMRSCYFISVVGNPAISVPAGFTPEGLPVGLQIVGRHQADWSVLQIAHAYEQATRFGVQRPALL